MIREIVCRRCRWPGMLVLTVALAAATFAAGESPYKSVLTETELAAMVEADAKIIADALAKGTPDKKGVSKIRAAALMLATYAQGAGDSQAGLRDRALRIGDAANKGQFDEIKKLIPELKPGAAPPDSKTRKPALQEAFDLAELMQQFKPERGGGLELEKSLQTAAKKRAALTANEIKNLIPVLLRIAVIAQPCEAFAPAADEGKKTRAQWNKWSQEMGALALDAARLAKAPKPDDKALKAVLNKMDANCTACHNVFRDSN